MSEPLFKVSQQEIDKILTESNDCADLLDQAIDHETI